MSHIHIPDGVLPIWLVLLGWALTAGLLVLSVRRLGAGGARERLPLLGVVSAVMLVAFSVAIAPLGYHLNLSVVAGIVLGPALGFLAAFIVDLVLALMGHGGITVVGLNTLVLGSEVALGSYAFRGLRMLFRRRLDVGITAGLTTVLSLFASTLLMIGIVASSNINPAWQLPRAAALEPETLAFRNPFGEGILAIELGPQREQTLAPALDIGTFARAVLALGAPGWLIEALVVGLLVRYLYHVMPDLVEAARPAERGAA